MRAKIGISPRPAASSWISRAVIGLARGPRRELVDLGRQRVEVVADELDERAARLGLGGRAEARELLADPRRYRPLRHVVHEHLAGLLDRFSERRVGLDVAGEREHGLRRGRGQVGGQRLDVRCLPAFHLVDEHEATTPEEPYRVAGGDGVVPACVPCGQVLDRVLAHPRAEAGERAHDLRPVAADDQIRRSEIACHGSECTQRVSADPEALAVGLDGDTPVEVGAVDVQRRRVGKGAQRRRASGGRSRCLPRPR